MLGATGVLSQGRLSIQVSIFLKLRLQWIVRKWNPGVSFYLSMLHDSSNFLS